MTVRQLVGDCRVQLAALEAGAVQACVTSPPYWGLRDYGTSPLVWGGDEKCNAALTLAINGAAAIECEHGYDACPICDSGHVFGATVRAPWANSVPGPSGNHPKNGTASHWTPKVSGQFCACGAWLGSLGLEPDPAMYVEHIVECFHHVRRVLRDDGTLWVNLGDSYAGSGNGQKDRRPSEASLSKRNQHARPDVNGWYTGSRYDGPSSPAYGLGAVSGYKPKDLMMMPFRVAMALQADGWYLRSIIPWLKRNSMPESVTDRPSTAVEYVFLLSKSSRYYWDADSVRVPQGNNTHSRGSGHTPKETVPGTGVKANSSFHAATNGVVVPGGRNRRNSDWFFESWQGLMLDEQDDPLALVVNPQPLKLAHFATFPPKLVEPMVKASTRPGDVILDPFGGAGTVGLVTDRLGRNAVLVDLKPEYSAMAVDRLTGDAPMFVEMGEAPA